MKTKDSLNLLGEVAAKPVSRRRFMAGAAAVAAPMILPSGVLGVGGKPGANERIVTGHIGVGGMGTAHLRGMADHVGAICDVDSQQAAKAMRVLPREVPVYSDYRRLLEDKGIDAVLIAAPDHWHALMMIHACEAGKDVYVEKPACNTIEEGRAMVNAAGRTKRVVQVGSQGRVHPGAIAVREFIRDGRIGQVTKVVCWHKDNPIGGDPANNGPAPDHLDWDMWLGPARRRPYNPDGCHRNFRWFLDLGGGQIRDRGAHVFNLASWTLGLDRTGPSRIEATGTAPTTGIWDCPTNFTVTYEFENPKLTVEWAQPGVKAGDFDFGAVYHGTKGKTIMLGGDGRVFPDEQVKEYAKSKGIESALPKRVRAHDYHRKDWLDCIKTRETPGMDIESGHRVASWCILANLAYQLERPVAWDPKAERFVNDESANHLLGSPGRGCWHL